MDLMFYSACPETRNWPHKVISEVFTDVTEQVNYFPIDYTTKIVFLCVCVCNQRSHPLVANKKKQIKALCAHLFHNFFGLTPNHNRI